MRYNLAGSNRVPRGVAREAIPIRHSIGSKAMTEWSVYLGQETPQLKWNPQADCCDMFGFHPPARGRYTGGRPSRRIRPKTVRGIIESVRTPKDAIERIVSE
jgi:hypothetical protein